MAHRLARLFSPAMLLVVLSWLLLQPGVYQPLAAAVPSKSLPPNTIVETVLADAGGVVVALAFAPDGRLFYTLKGGFGGEQTAEVRIIENDVLRPTPFLTTRVDASGERGLLGVAFDPNFHANHYVYIFKTAPASETDTGHPSNRVIRYTEDPATQTAIPDSATVLLDVPIGPENDPHTNHNGGMLHFGPDGKLYVSLGDYGRNPDNAQNLGNHMGKVHRLNPDDGSAPVDNPFFSEPPGAVRSIWAYGLRNPFDFVFDPLSGRMFFTENGPGCDDEINLGQPGGNYGWSSAYECGSSPEGTIPPIYRYAPAPGDTDMSVGISGIDMYQGSVSGMISEWQHTLFWCAWETGELYHARLDGSRTSLEEGSVGYIEGVQCTIDVQHGPDGALYVASNYDDPSSEDPGKNIAIARIRSTLPPENVFLPLVLR